AQRTLKMILDEEAFQPKAVFGLWPANSNGDDVELYDSENSQSLLSTFHFLRQQKAKSSDEPQWCLADFIRPKADGIHDYIGAFAVTIGDRVEQLSQSYRAKNDDFTAIMIKALGDRL